MAQLRSCIGHPGIGPCRERQPLDLIANLPPYTSTNVLRSTFALCWTQTFHALLQNGFESRQSHMLREVQGFKVPAFCQIRQYPRCIGSQLQLRGCHNSLRRLGFCRPGSLRGSCRAVSCCCLQASCTFSCLLEHGIELYLLACQWCCTCRSRESPLRHSLWQIKCVGLTQLL